MHKKPIIGILGGVGSGKSTVAKMFGALGAAVIDADRLAHEELKKPEVIEQVKQIFGLNVINPSGFVDHAKLAQVVFDDQSAIRTLNELIHPRVIQKTESLIDVYQNDLQSKAVVLDIPLLVEIGWETRCDYLIFVDCSRQKRLERLKKRKIDEKQLKKRENLQISLDKKAVIAHYKVDNNSDESEVAEQVAQIFSSITSIE